MQCPVAGREFHGLRTSDMYSYLHAWSLWMFSSHQVSKDVRSDIESSSEEEPETTPTLTASAKRENGTNGHLGSQPWARKDESWWHADTSQANRKNCSYCSILIPLLHPFPDQTKH